MSNKNRRRKKRRKRGSSRQRRSILERLASKARILIPSFSRRVWSIIVGVSVLITILGGVVAFSAKVSVTTDEGEIDPVHVSYRTFTVSNESSFPLKDVSFQFTVLNVEPDDIADWFIEDNLKLPVEDKEKMGGLKSWKMRPGPTYVAQSLASGEQKSIPIVLPFGMLKEPVTRASVEVVITYRPFFLIWTQEKRFRFDAYDVGSGKLVWRAPMML